MAILFFLLLVCLVCDARGTNSNQESATWLVNIGGPQVGPYVADNVSLLTTTGSSILQSSHPITMANYPKVFQYARFDKEKIAYRIPVEEGVYSVRLMFAELEADANRIIDYQVNQRFGTVNLLEAGQGDIFRGIRVDLDGISSVVEYEGDNHWSIVIAVSKNRDSTSGPVLNGLVITRLEGPTQQPTPEPPPKDFPQWKLSSTLAPLAR